MLKKSLKSLLFTTSVIFLGQIASSSTYCAEKEVSTLKRKFNIFEDHNFTSSEDELKSFDSINNDHPSFPLDEASKNYIKSKEELIFDIWSVGQAIENICDKHYPKEVACSISYVELKLNSKIIDMYISFHSSIRNNYGFHRHVSDLKDNKDVTNLTIHTKFDVENVAPIHTTYYKDAFENLISTGLQNKPSLITLTIVGEFVVDSFFGPKLCNDYFDIGRLKSAWEEHPHLQFFSNLQELTVGKITSSDNTTLGSITLPGNTAAKLTTCYRFLMCFLDIFPNIKLTIKDYDSLNEYKEVLDLHLKFSRCFSHNYAVGSKGGTQFV